MKSPQSSSSNSVEELSKAALLYLEQGKSAEAIALFDRALGQNPVHQFSLWNRSIACMRLGNMDAALSDLYTLLRENPKNLDARNQIRFIHRKLVGNWHFDMMNDAVRNEAYQKAIERAVTPSTTVFEIGTGSGLLSMMAARAGAKHIYTTEKSMPIRKAAREIIRKNGFAEKITLLEKWSTSVSIPDDIPERVDLVIGEIFGPGLLEEQALHFFEDAKARLLKPNGKILPARATMYASLFESEDVVRRAIVGNVCGFDVSLFNGLHDDPAVQLTLPQHRHKLLSETFMLRKIEFGVKDSKPFEEKLSVVATETGTCNGASQWFRLETDDANVIDTGPSMPRTHWDQNLQVFEKPFSVVKGQKIEFLLRQFSDRFSLHRIG